MLICVSCMDGHILYSFDSHGRVVTAAAAAFAAESPPEPLSISGRLKVFAYSDVQREEIDSSLLRASRDTRRHLFILIRLYTA